MAEIVIFEQTDQPTEVRVATETVWLTQAQMADVFDTSTDNIGLHLKNIYSSAELAPDATTEDFSVVRQEGKRQVKRRLKRYNLDAIISVGYRVNSHRATAFRQWPTHVLHEQLTQGYSLNEHRLAQLGLSDLGKRFADSGKMLPRVG